ncbi:MAG TPA: hypothetical protein VJ834_04435 [Burkholderiales bacterium]|nr:hypothetical protein [Burkholderiales bacterium]
MKPRASFLSAAAMAFAATEIGRNLYRPWVRQSNVDDFGLADSLGSLGGVAVAVFLVAAIVGRTRAISLGGAAGTAVGALVYEFLQPTLRSGTFDWNDVVAIIIGSVVALLIVWLIWLRASGARASPQLG